MKTFKIHSFLQFTSFSVVLFLIFLTSAKPSNLTIHFTNMSPHINQNLYLRVIDKGTLQETARAKAAINNVNFDILIDALTTDHSYFIDFFADNNSNDLYDPPPADHTWRLELNNAAGDGSDELNFSHNTNFTDIDWRYELTIHFKSMTPHLNQSLELRVEDNSNDKEVNRIKVDTITTADFDVKIPGIKINTEYKVEFYADHNGNGLYDAPPVDHAWRVDFTNTTGDAELEFIHNTNFTDINWKYLLTVNLLDMVPHLGELFELRVVKIDDQKEIGRVSLDSILIKDFSIRIPEIELNHDYNIDFYADHNLNGMYDSPPTDHAWRLTFKSQNGDFVENFTHNTNFTDIQWPGATSVEQTDFSPKKFSLSQNYPNPFNPSTVIEFEIADRSFTSLKVYNLIGEVVDVLVNDNLTPGRYKFTWQPFNLASGVYYYKISSGNFNETKKMLFLK